MHHAYTCRRYGTQRRYFPDFFSSPFPLPPSPFYSTGFRGGANLIFSIMRMMVCLSSAT